MTAITSALAQARHWIVTILEKLSESTRLSCPASLLSVYIVHGRVPGEGSIQCIGTCGPHPGASRPESQRKTVVQPWWALKDSFSIIDDNVRSRKIRKGFRHTAPTKYGSFISKQATLSRIQKNPSKVTILGASHRGRSSTAAVHCLEHMLAGSPLQRCHHGRT